MPSFSVLIMCLKSSSFCGYYLLHGFLFKYQPFLYFLFIYGMVIVYSIRAAFMSETQKISIPSTYNGPIRNDPWTDVSRVRQWQRGPNILFGQLILKRMPMHNKRD